jgi:CBS domain-containing protein
MNHVCDILRSKPYALIGISPTASVFHALGTMAARDIGALVVLEHSTLVGMFTERDYARKVVLLGRSSRDVAVRDVMTTGTPTVCAGDTVDTCMALMTNCRVRHLPVCDGPTVVGVISIGDVVKAILDDQRFTIERLEHYITG